MTFYESSIIIPVYNKWELTRNCLKSVASTLKEQINAHKIEIIIIDNASRDVTLRACPVLGKQLFGEDFKYIRNENNRNFAGASNQGAKIAQGAYLIFLNNDTLPQSGWYEPLLNDFSNFLNIGATGPILAYPEHSPLGLTVQHLGVIISPFYTLGHLYAHIPVNSRLARKRRFFQVITAACMVMPKSLFLAEGGFDEGYINGFEDVDLCARLGAMGYKMTVNPESMVIHMESQTPGRHFYDEGNQKRLARTSLKLLKPDWNEMLKKDDLVLKVTNWAFLQAGMPEHPGDAIFTEVFDTPTGLQEAVIKNPYWLNGWQKLLRMAKSNSDEDYLKYYKLFLQLLFNPDYGYQGFLLGLKYHDEELKELGRRYLLDNCFLLDDYFANTEMAYKRCNQLGLIDLASQYKSWLINFPCFKNEIYPRLAKSYIEYGKLSGKILPVTDNLAYNMWIYAKNSPNIICAHINKFNILICLEDDSQLVLTASNLLAHLDSLQQNIKDLTINLIIACNAPRNLKNGIDWNKNLNIKIIDKQKSEFQHTLLQSLEEGYHLWTLLITRPVIFTSGAIEIFLKKIEDCPGALLVYSDEDFLKNSESHDFCNPYFKNERWDSYLIKYQNFVGGAAFFDTGQLMQTLIDNGEIRKADEFIKIYSAACEPSKLVHIPELLYHNVGDVSYPEPQVLEDGLNPSKVNIPKITLICLIYPGSFKTGGDFEEYHKRVTEYAETGLEIIYITSCNLPDCASFKILSVSEKQNIYEKINEAASLANGDLLGFTTIGGFIKTENWPEKLGCQFNGQNNSKLGAIGSVIRKKEGGFKNCGYFTDATGVLKPLFPDVSKISYHHWQKYPHLVMALDFNGLFTKKELFIKFDGFWPKMGESACLNYCLLLSENGWDCVWNPMIEYQEIIDKPNVKSIKPNSVEFKNFWQNRLKPFNPNVVINHEFLALNME